jgi:hypothetical protein
VIGAEFEKGGVDVAKGKAGRSNLVSLMRQRTLVDFAVEGMDENRKEMPRFDRQPPDES